MGVPDGQHSHPIEPTGFPTWTEKDASRFHQTPIVLLTRVRDFSVDPGQDSK
jgi:hypothetical protein